MFYAWRMRAGRGCVWKYHASFESSSRENAKSLFGPRPFEPVLLFALIQSPRRAAPATLPLRFCRLLRGSLGATDDRLLSRCKLSEVNSGDGGGEKQVGEHLREQCVRADRGCQTGLFGGVATVGSARCWPGNRLVLTSGSKDPEK